jgi:outer membrane lipoprotein-sorting protein
MIEKVTAADVERVAKKYVHPDQLAVLVVGKESAFERPLSTLGPVTTIDITIPPADAGEKKAAPAASSVEGVGLLQKVQEFVGGKANIDAVRASRMSATMSMVTPQGEMSADTVTLMQYPSSLRQEMTLPMGKITTVITSESGFVITPMGTQDLPSSRREAAVADFKSDLFHILKNADNPKYKFTVTGTEKIGDVDAQILEISPDGAAVRWYIDPATGRILRTVRTTQMGETVTNYTEWKKFGALNMPIAAEITRGGEKAGSMQVKDVEVNPALDEKAFVKP